MVPQERSLESVGSVSHSTFRNSTNQTSKPAVWELKYLGVLFSNRGRMKWKTDKWTEAESALLWMLWHFLWWRKSCGKYSPLTCYSVFNPNLITSHGSGQKNEVANTSQQKSFIWGIAYSKIQHFSELCEVHLWKMHWPYQLCSLYHWTHMRVSSLLKNTLTWLIS